MPRIPLPLRLVISEPRDEQADKCLAASPLWADFPSHFPATAIALWHDRHLRIKTYFKLLESTGLPLQGQKQQNADTVTRRLLVARIA